MRFFEFNQPAIGDIVEIELGEELIEAVITAITADEIVVETDSISGANLLVESYGKYWCSTDKKWKERQGPKQTRKTSEAVEEINEIKKGQKDSNGYTRCWPGKHAEGTKKGKNGGTVRNCVPNESLEEASSAAQQAAIAIAKKKKQGVAEGSDNVSASIKALYQKIYNAGDDEIEYFYNDSPIFAQYWDEYEGDLDAIIAEVDPDELQVILDELESYAQQAGLAEGEKSPMFKDAQKADRIRSLKNLISIAKEQGRQLRVQELELELKKLQGVAEAEYQGRNVPLGKPMQGDVKKFKVYVRDPKTGNVKKVNFGDPNMRIKKSNPKRRKSFRARHNCSNPGPRTKARYWSCRKW